MRDEAPGASPAQPRRFSLRSLAVAATVSIAAGALAFSPVFAPSADATMVNLLTENQQSIEADPTGWMPIDVARSWRSGQAASTGSQSLLVAAIGYGFKGNKPMAVSTLRGVSGVPVASGSAYEGRVDVRAQQKATSASCVLTWFAADGSYQAQSAGAWKSDSSARWTTLDCSGTAPSGAAFAALRVRFASVSLGNIHYLDGAALLGNRVAAPASAGPTTTAEGPTTTVGSPTTSPTTTVAPTTTTTAAAPPPTTPPPPSSGGPVVNEVLIPAGSAGSGVSRIGASPYATLAGDGSASFRVNCAYSHMNFDDPIVFPGRSRATHLHIFFGNKGAAASSTPESIRTTGNSTCSGGTANRSAYWAPAVINTATGAPVISDSSATDREHFLQVYYKTGYDGIVPTTVANFPAGLRMIAGTSTSTGPQPGIVTYSCLDNSNRHLLNQSSFPNCAAGQIFLMAVEFPQCWDGVNLDSPNHKSHMAYGVGWPDKGCPSSHPVPLAQITQNFRYRVPAGGMSAWRLSSDMYSGPAGYSGHADWMNGWDAPTFQRVVTNCYRTVIDCRMNLLGDGQMLLG